jgi:hypothetical protein
VEETDLRVLDEFRPSSGRDLHRRRGDDLHQVVDDHVAQRADRIVEVTAVLDAEVLRHRDLNRLEVVPAPQRLEHRVREPQEDDLLEAHLPEVVVDPVELRLLDVLMELSGQLVRRGQVVAEGLLDHDAPALRESRVVQALDDPAEEERRDLEVEDGSLRAVDRLRDALVGRLLAEVAGHVGKAVREAVENLFIQRLARALDRLARAVLQLIDGPVVDGHADDRAVEQAPLLEPVERVEGHHLRQVARDPEDDEDVRRLLSLFCRARLHLGCSRRHVPSPS